MFALISALERWGVHHGLMVLRLDDLDHQFRAGPMADAGLSKISCHQGYARSHLVGDYYFGNCDMAVALVHLAFVEIANWIGARPRLNCAATRK